MTTYYLACDLGADSGRLMLGTLDNRRLTLEELHRFANTPIKAAGALHWNIDALWQELKTGLKKAAARKLPYASISCDSWGVDYLLFDREGKIVQPTFHYRDARTEKGVAMAKSKVSWETIYAETGIQFMALNTLYQLAAETPERLQRAQQMIPIGDAFNYFLSHVARAEVSLASTTQLYNPVSRTWSGKLLSALNLPERLFPAIVSSGSRLGPLCPALASETGLSGVEVLATCSHDTGAAVAAVPGFGSRWAYLSSGTWSLMGVERPQPIINETGRELNFTNEIGYGNTTRLLKNIIGLWLVQESRREWAKAGREYSFADLEKLAAEAPPFGSLINPSDARFLQPDGMPEKIASCCRETNQPVPATPGATIRCIAESLALLYRRTLKQIERLTGENIERLHIVGGGGKDRLLNQFTANALQIPVHVGPVEATAIGNIVIQAITLGHLKSLADARQVIHESMNVSVVQPQDAAPWNAAFERFEKILGAKAG